MVAKPTAACAAQGPAQGPAQADNHDTPWRGLDENTRQFYLRALDVLGRANVPFLVGGAYALAHYAGIVRHTKDLDLFVRREHLDRAFRACEAAGYRTELTHPHWVGKAFESAGPDSPFIDFIYGSGNGLACVDEEWFAHAVEGEALGRCAPLAPAEEIIWSKSFVQERHRFDGADINHLILARGPLLDWRRLIRRFTSAESILLGHLMFFGYVYPSEVSAVPDWVMQELFSRVCGERPPAAKVCRGTCLSWEQYLPDIQQHGFQDGRITPHGKLTTEQVQRWTDAEK